MVQRRDSAVLGTLLLPIAVVLGYGFVTGLGLIWPETPRLAIIASIVVSILLWFAAGYWFVRRTGWWRIVAVFLFAAAFVFPMVGAASLGTDLALEQRADKVTGQVSDIAVEQTNKREGKEAWRTTYSFRATDDGRDLGTVDYRGKENGYDLEVGDRTELLVDPEGDLPVKLAETVDSANDLIMLALGAVLFGFCYALGLVWPLVRRAFS